jgi:hypothetical protein
LLRRAIFADSKRIFRRSDSKKLEFNLGSSTLTFQLWGASVRRVNAGGCYDSRLVTGKEAAALIADALSLSKAGNPSRKS